MRQVLMLAVAACGIGPATLARADDPPPAVAGFERFFQQAQPTCSFDSSLRCVELGFSYADRDGDGRLTQVELDALQADFGSWAQWKSPEMTKRERTSVALGSYAVQAIGLENFIAAYDDDADGALSRQELLADVTLDQRPLGQVLQDPEAVDWAAVQRRLGPAAPLLGALSATTQAR